MSTRLRPPTPKPGEAVTVAPGRYPVFSSATAMQFSHALRDSEVLAASDRVLAGSADAMRATVLGHVAKVEAAALTNDFTRIYDKAHEIRGLAGNAGLATTAQIADCLCRYLDALSRVAKRPQPAVVRLHTEAISRAVRGEDHEAGLGVTVAAELAQLVEKKIAEINESASAGTPPPV